VISTRRLFAIFQLGLGAIALGGPLSCAGLASGSYSSRPPQPPDAVIQNSRRYELGKAIFAGKLELKDRGPQAGQLERLKGLQGRLPAAKRAAADLPALAGKLSADQMAALEYYLEIRYKIK
jgi:hypothetical protein